MTGVKIVIDRVKQDAAYQVSECLAMLRVRVEKAQASVQAGDVGMVNVHAMSIESAAGDLMKQSMRACTARKIETDMLIQ